VLLEFFMQNPAGSGTANQPDRIAGERITSWTPKTVDVHYPLGYGEKHMRPKPSSADILTTCGASGYPARVTASLP